jgi:VWFA-related protein
VKNWSAFFLIFATGLLTASGRGASADTKAFPAQPGDTVIVQNDYGRVQVRGISGSQVISTARATLAAGGNDHARIAAQKVGDKVFLYAFFGNVPGESVEFEIDVPRYVNVMISGANPEVSVQNVDGYVRVNTLTGIITADDLTSSVSLTSDKGDIVYRLRNQPAGDARIETIHGQVACELAPTVNLKVWARAGENLSWGDTPQRRGEPMEKLVGSGGPLLYVSSFQSGVRIDVGKVSPAPAIVPQSPPPPPAPQESRSSATPDLRSAPPPEPEAPAGRERPRPVLSRERRETPAPQEESAPQPAPQQQSRDSSENGQPAGQDSAGNPTFRVAVDWVFLNVSVRDRATNRSLTDLRQQDFLVYEDNVQQTVGQFETTEVPFNLLLLLDVSGSTESFLHLIKSASIDFTRQIKQNDRIAVAVFNSRVQLIQGFTSDRAQVARAIDSIRSGGGTAFYDALETCAEDYMRDVEGRKAIVVFTDGVDNQLAGNGGEGSRITFDQLYRNIQEIDPIIYPIFLDSESDQGVMTGNPGGTAGSVAIILGDILGGGRRGPVSRPRRYPGGGGVSRQVYDQAREQLQMIADQTGGRMYSPRVADDLRGVYSEIADDLRIQYRIGYSPTNKAQDGSWRALRVKLKNYPDAAVRTRKGYYASPGTQRLNRFVPEKRTADSGQPTAKA